MKSRIVVLQKIQNADTPKIAPDGDYELIIWRTPGELTNLLRSQRKNQKGIAILYSESLPIEEADLPAVLIHHGIGNDGTFDPPTRGRFVLALADVRRCLRSIYLAYKMLGHFGRFSTVVCVDTNVINLFRYFYPMYEPGEHLAYIPNWGDPLDKAIVTSKWEHADASFTVLYARRFNFVRGAELWYEALQILAQKYPNVMFRCCGYGPYAKDFESIMARYANVRVEARQLPEMTSLYQAAHISVVPSLWSEGTPLTAIESMAAGCALVVSNVGGLGNIVLPDVNGLIVAPTISEIVNAVSKLVENPKMAKRLGMMGYEIATQGLTREAWEQRMLQVFERAIAHPHEPFPVRRLKFR
jgi:glycosyltransferase involved in cell wall biosynthesis